MDLIISQYSFEFLSNYFTNIGFKKSGKLWYKNFNDIQIVCQYQKSSFSENFFLNFGISFSALLPSKKNPASPSSWHFTGRYEQILGDPRFSINIDSNITLIELDKLLNNIATNLSKIVLPYLYNWSDMQFLKENFPKHFDYTKMQVTYIKTSDLHEFIQTTPKSDN